MSALIDLVANLC